MHGPKKRAGAVAALEGVRMPSRVAREVMNQTDHHLSSRGSAEVRAPVRLYIEDDLNTPAFPKVLAGMEARTDLCTT